MYHLMKSEKFVLEHVVSGSISSYRQTEIDHFRRFNAALQACAAANGTDNPRFYVRNESGQEYYHGKWMG
jgi:hypothetical protein